MHAADGVTVHYSIDQALVKAATDNGQLVAAMRTPHPASPSTLEDWDSVRQTVTNQPAPTDAIQ